MARRRKTVENCRGISTDHAISIFNNEPVPPVNSFRRNFEQFQFNIAHLEKKYARLEKEGRHTGIELNMDTFEMYVPENMSESEAIKHKRKLEIYGEQFGLGKISAPCNDSFAFGDKYKKRVKECKRLDLKFDALFKSKYPYWIAPQWGRRSISTPVRKSPRRLERVIVRENVKEYTFDNAMAYLDHVMEKENIPEAIFHNQKKLDITQGLSLKDGPLLNNGVVHFSPRMVGDTHNRGIFPFYLLLVYLSSLHTIIGISII